MTDIQIRKATAHDAALILNFITGLAIYENLRAKPQDEWITYRLTAESPTVPADSFPQHLRSSAST